MSQFDPFGDRFGESEELVREVLTPRPPRLGDPMRGHGRNV